MIDKIFNIKPENLVKAEYIIALYIPRGTIDYRDMCGYSLMRIIDNKREILLNKTSYDKTEIVKEAYNIKTYFNARLIQTD